MEVKPPRSASPRQRAKAVANQKALAKKELDEELQLLRDPMALASAGLLLTCIQDNSRSTSPTVGGGCIIFSLDELPLNTSWQTLAGHYVCRVADTKINYFVGPAHQSLLGAEVYGIDVRPLAKTIEYLPQDLLVRILVFLPTADYVACRLVSPFWRKVITEHVMSSQVATKLNESITRFMQNHFARLPTELVLHIFTFLRAKDICRVSQACFTFWSLVDHNEDRLWEALFQRRWVHSRDKLMDAYGCSRKLFYILNDRLLRAKCLLGHHKELLAEYAEHVPRGQATPVVKGQLTTADSSPDNESTATPAEQPEARPEQTEGGGKPDEALMVAAERWGVSRVESKHPESAEFLRYTLREIDQRHFSTTGLAARSPRVNANVLVIGPKAIGKSSFVMKALADRFESNGDQLDLDQFGASASKLFPINAIDLNIRVFTLCRIPDYNDLFNVAAVVVAYDISSNHGLSEALRWAKEARREGRHNLVLAAVGLRKDLVTRKRDDTAAAKQVAIGVRVTLYAEYSALQASSRTLTKFFGRIARRVAEYPELWVAPINVPTHPPHQ